MSRSQRATDPARVPVVRRRRLAALVVAAISLVSVNTASLGSSDPATLLSASPASAAGPHAEPARHRSRQWVGTWATAPSGGIDNGCRDCTIRNVIHTSTGGHRVRVRLSNVFGTAPLTVGDATVALPSVPSSPEVAPGTLRQLTFHGRERVVIPTGRDVMSDPVKLDVPAASDLLVTTFTPGYSTRMTFHPGAQQDSFFTTGPNRAHATSAAALPRKTQAWHFVTGVEVAGSPARGAVVAFGDSITDGFGSTPNVDHRWPDYLAGRLLRERPGRQLSVLNAGIGGNRVLLDGGDGFGPAALDRFDRDVLDHAGVRSVIILEGINDIQQTPHQLDPKKIIAGLRELAVRARRADLRVLGGTLTPFEGWYTYNAEQEATREAVNHWIRTTRVFDAVVDFDAAIRDPANPHRMLPLYDLGDHLHPNDIGYAVMGDAVPLSEL